jgi:tyrosyl-DNA phosphodiesterase-1
VATPTWSFDDVPKQTLTPTSSLSTKQAETKATTRDGNNDTRFVASPVHLTRIQGLAAHQNVDAVGLGDLLGDPLIRECWNFNFLFDLDFVMYVTKDIWADVYELWLMHP